MSIFGDIFGAITGLFGGGGGGNNALANLISGGLTSQRIPGQTRAGEYTPPQGGFGTYNYIPTGATQIDPALIWQILNGGAYTNDAMSQSAPFNQQLLQQTFDNPYAGLYQGAMSDAGNLAGQNAQSLNNAQQWLSSNFQPGWNMVNNAAGATENLLLRSQQNPFAQGYIDNASQIGQGMQTQGADLSGTAAGTLGSASGITDQLLANPYLGAAQGAANTAGGMLQNTGANQYGLGQTFTGQVAAGLPAAGQILNTAFDPQNALYQRTAQQTMDQLGTMLARTGLTDSGVGSKLVSDALSNFNIDWQNNQLDRQSQGLQSYTQGMTGAGANLGTGGALQTGGAQTYAQGGALPAQTYQALGSTQLGNLGALTDILGPLGGALQTGSNLQLGGAGAGNAAYQGQLANELGYAQAYGGAGKDVLGAYGNIGDMAGQLSNLGQQAVNFTAQQGQLPYGAYYNNLTNQNTGLSNFLGNATSMGNMNNQTIDQMLRYLGSVMTGSGNAANAAGGAQGRTMDQNAAASAGLSPLIGQGLDWLGSLFNRGGGFNNQILV